MSVVKTEMTMRAQIAAAIADLLEADLKYEPSSREGMRITFPSGYIDCLAVADVVLDKLMVLPADLSPILSRNHKNKRINIDVDCAHDAAAFSAVIKAIAAGK